MSEEVQSAIQVIELFGRMMKGAKDIGVAGIKLGAFGISGMVKLSKLKDMQDSQLPGSGYRGRFIYPE